MNTHLQLCQYFSSEMRRIIKEQTKSKISKSNQNDQFISILNGAKVKDKKTAEMLQSFLYRLLDKVEIDKIYTLQFGVSKIESSLGMMLVLMERFDKNCGINGDNAPTFNEVSKRFDKNSKEYQSFVACKISEVDGDPELYNKILESFPENSAYRQLLITCKNLFKLTSKQKPAPEPEKKPEHKTETKKHKLRKKSDNSQQIKIVDYSEKAIAVFGNTKSYKNKFLNIYGRFNPNLKIKNEKVPGWVFSKKRKEEIEKLIAC
jgi:hypothetical protein